MLCRPRPVSPGGPDRRNALRSALALVVNTIALVLFVLFGPVALDAAAVMAVASLAGGWAGASISQRVNVTRSAGERCGDRGRSGCVMLAR